MGRFSSWLFLGGVTLAAACGPSIDSTPPEPPRKVALAPKPPAPDSSAPAVPKAEKPMDAPLAPKPPPAPAPLPPPPEPVKAAPKTLFPGLVAPPGPRGTPQRVPSLTIKKPGVYEDYLVDAGFAPKDAVRILADGVTLRNCEIRNGARDGIEVYASDVLIENCRIHHFLNGAFTPHLDSHGITGQPRRLTIRNCEIYYVTGDCLQFDPGREPWDEVLVENCVLWTGPLPEDAGAFKKGERPGENALDTKQKTKNPRSRITLRNVVAFGWKQPGQIDNLAAMNIKNHVEARLENCVFYDNEICLRLRGPGSDPGGYGGAWVTAENCSFYSSDVALRFEDRIEKTRIVNPLFGPGVREQVWGDRNRGRGTEVVGGGAAPALGAVLGKE